MAELSGDASPPRDDVAWWGEPDPVEVFAAGIELALRQLRVEVAGLRAERDGLRLELAGTRAKLDFSQEQLASRDSLGDAVRQLRSTIGWLTTGAADAADVAAVAAPVYTAGPPAEPSAIEQLKAMGVWPDAEAVDAPAPEPPEPIRSEPTLQPSPTEPTPPPRMPLFFEEPEEDDLEDEDEVEVVGASPRRRSLARRVAGAALTLVIVAVVLVVIAVSVGPLVLPYRTYFVRSGSMEPGIPTGAVVVATESEPEDLRVGDVITFARPGNRGVTVTHRIVGIDETTTAAPSFVTKGDANDRVDPWRVPVADVRWKHRFEVPFVGYAFAFLGTPGARVALLLVPIALLAAFAVRRRRR